MCHGPLRFCNDLHVLKVDPYHVEQPLKQFWSCLNDWTLFSVDGKRLLKNVIYDLWKSASPEAFYSPLFAVVHYFFDRVYFIQFIFINNLFSTPLYFNLWLILWCFGVQIIVNRICLFECRWIYNRDFYSLLIDFLFHQNWTLFARLELGRFSWRWFFVINFKFEDSDDIQRPA